LKISITLLVEWLELKALSSSSITTKKKIHLDLAWWSMPKIPAFQMPNKGDHIFKASLGYIARHSLKKEKQTTLLLLRCDGT
jgi:hypothetical protein